MAAYTCKFDTPLTAASFSSTKNMAPYRIMARQSRRRVSRPKTVRNSTAYPTIDRSSTPQAAATAEQKVSEVQQSVAQGQPATLRLDETELNSYLANHLDLAPSAATPSQGGGSNAPTDADVEQVRSSVRDVKVQMEGDQVHAYLVFDLHGKEMSLDLVGKLGAADGYLKFEPVSGHIGSLPIPQSALESAVKQLMESPVNREKLRLPSDVSDLRIENGELVTTYH